MPSTRPASADSSPHSLDVPQEPVVTRERLRTAESRKALASETVAFRSFRRRVVDAWQARRRPCAETPTAPRGAPVQRGRSESRPSSRRTRTSSKSSSQDSELPDEPEPARGGRYCKNPAHELYGGPVDLDNFPWVDDKAEHCHRACRQQAQRFRDKPEGWRPRHLASNPEGWGRPRRSADDPARQCKCNSVLNWHSPREAVCIYCGKSVSFSRWISWAQDPRARTIRLGREAIRAADVFRGTGVPREVLPVVYAASFVNLDSKRHRKWKGERGTEADVRKYQEQRAAEYEQAREDAAIAESATEVEPEDDALVRAAAEAHGEEVAA